MNKFKTFTIIAAAAVMFFSCAKEESYSSQEQLREIFEAYMDQYGGAAIRTKEGVYMEQLQAGQEEGAKTPREGNWVRINYTIRNLSPIVSTEFATRYVTTAERLGISTPYTHYTPEYLEYDELNGKLMSGIYYALKYMKEGDVYRVFIPSYMAFPNGSENSIPSVYGYSVEKFNVGSSTHIVMDLELTEVVPDPQAAETEQVRRYATQVMGLSLADSVAENVYKRTLFYSSNDTDNVGIETTILYRYLGTFFDGFIFDTNIADSAINKGQYIPSNSYGLLATTTTGVTGSTLETLEPSAVIPGLDSAFCHMRYGEVAEVVMTSAQAYGSSGSYPTDDEGYAAAGTVIQPYTPLRFVIQAGPKYGNGTRTFPYSVKGIQRDGLQTDVWFWGYLVGAVHGNDISGAEFKYVRDRWNILLGETGNTADAVDCVPIELPAGEMREALNLPSNIKRFTMRVLVRGDATNYLGTLGITNVTEYLVTEIYGVTYEADKLYPESEWID